MVAVYATLIGMGIHLLGMLEPGLLKVCSRHHVSAVHEIIQGTCTHSRRSLAIRFSPAWLRCGQAQKGIDNTDRPKPGGFLMSESWRGSGPQGALASS